MSQLKVGRYAAYKDSGVEWLGEVPEHWEIKHLKALAEIKGGKDSSGVEVGEGGYPVYGSGGIFGRASAYLHNKPSVLLGRKGTVDKPLFVTEPFWSVDTMFYTYIKRNVDPKFFYYRCITIQFGFYQYGSAVPSMASNVLSRILFAVPPLPEQTAIAAYLDSKTAQIDRQIDLLSQKATQYGKLKQSLINETVTRGLDKSVPMKDCGVEWIGEVPAHWLICRLKDKVIFNPSKSEIKNNPRDCTFAPMDKLKTDSLLTDTTIITSDISSSYTYFREGDVLIAKVTPCFENRNIAIAKNLTNGIGFGSSEINVVRVFKNTNKRWFFYLFLSSNFIEAGASKMAGAGGLKRIPSLFLETFAFAIPPLLEQTTIAAYLDTKTTQIDRIVSTINQQIDQLTDCRKALINDVVTGKMKVLNAEYAT